jgi:hypothetical protein
MPKRKVRIVKRAGTSRCAEYVNIAMHSSRLPHIPQPSHGDPIHANFIVFLPREPRLKRSLTHHSVAL